MIEWAPPGLSLNLITAATATAAFVAGGTVKGTLGVGLPLVTVPILSLAIPVPLAISLVIVPVLASNIWQAADSGISISGAKRFASLSVALMVTTLLTVPLTLAMPERVLNAMVAAAVILAVVLMSIRVKVAISERQERIASPVIGAVSGVMGGVSSLTGPIIISYVMALKLSREEFVGTMSVIYLAGAISLYGSFIAYGRLGLTELLLSAAAMIPVALGLAMGRALRGRLNEAWFRRVLLIFLCVIAVALLFR